MTDQPTYKPLPENWRKAVAIVAHPDDMEFGAAAAVDPAVAGAADAAGPDTAYTPDTALVNLYGRGSTMGLHQDRDEASSAPVVSLSLGDACTFRFGTPEHRGRPRPAGPSRATHPDPAARRHHRDLAPEQRHRPRTGLR